MSVIIKECADIIASTMSSLLGIYLAVKYVERKYKLVNNTQIQHQNQHSEK